MLLIRCIHCREVGVKPLVSYGDQPLVEPPLIGAALVAADEQNCLAVGSKGKSHAPHLARPSKSRKMDFPLTETGAGAMDVNPGKFLRYKHDSCMGRTHKGYRGKMPRNSHPLESWWQNWESIKGARLEVAL